MQQAIDLSQDPPEQRLRFDPARLGPGGSPLARYLDLWREARTGDSLSLLSRIQGRGLDRRIMVIDQQQDGGFIYRSFGAGLSFLDAAARAHLIGKPQEAFADEQTLLAAREGYLHAVASDAPVCEYIDRPRLHSSGRPLPRRPYRRLILPVPVNARVTRLIVASELIPLPGGHRHH